MITLAEYEARINERESLKTKRDMLKAIIDESKAEIKELSEQIATLDRNIWQYEKYHAEHCYDYTKTLAYQMFGKRLKDLNDNECREYYTMRQRSIRARQKENTK